VGARREPIAQELGRAGGEQRLPTKGGGERRELRCKTSFPICFGSVNIHVSS